MQSLLHNSYIYDWLRSGTHLPSCWAKAHDKSCLACSLHYLFSHATTNRNLVYDPVFFVRHCTTTLHLQASQHQDTSAYLNHCCQHWQTHPLTLNHFLAPTLILHTLLMRHLRLFKMFLKVIIIPLYNVVPAHKEPKVHNRFDILILTFRGCTWP